MFHVDIKLTISNIQFQCTEISCIKDKSRPLTVFKLKRLYPDFLLSKTKIGMAKTLKWLDGGQICLVKVTTTRFKERVAFPVSQVFVWLVLHKFSSLIFLLSKPSLSISLSKANLSISVPLSLSRECLISAMISSSETTDCHGYSGSNSW